MTQIPRQALVTGASGMLGSHIVEALVEAGIGVKALARPTSNVQRLSNLPVEIVYRQAERPGNLTSAVAGADWVFHAAGPVGVEAPFNSSKGGAKFDSGIVELTEALLAASLEAGVARFVHTSSTSVYAPAIAAPTAEEAPLRPVSAYGIAKLKAEERVRAYQTRGMATTIIRPTVIYGPRDRYFTPTLLRLAGLPALPLVDGGRHLFDIVYVRDVADLMLRACQTPEAAGKVYNAGPPAPISSRELVETFRRLTGRGPRIISISAGRLRRLAGLVGWLLAKVAPGSEGILNSHGLDLLSQDWYLDTARATADLGYTAQVGLERGLALTLAYYGRAARNNAFGS
jgi:nucleoside-diphosphate-sugar epimerase